VSLGCSFSQRLPLAGFRDIFIMARPGWRRHYIPPLMCVALLVLLPGGSASEPLPDQLAADGLGPLLVNKDGSLQRISNWAELTKQEREAAVRAALRRNTKRLEELTRLEELRKADKREGKAMAGGLSQWIQRSRQRAAKLWRRVISWFRQIKKGQSASTSGESSPTTHSAQQTAEEAERALPPIDFAPEYVLPILSGVKGATTRWLKAEPKLKVLLGERGRQARATCARCKRAEDREYFATLEVTRAEKVLFGELSDELAQLEGFNGGAKELKAVLKGFYPGVREDSVMSVLHFHVLSAPEWSEVLPPSTAALPSGGQIGRSPRASADSVAGAGLVPESAEASDEDDFVVQEADEL